MKAGVSSLAWEGVDVEDGGAGDGVVRSVRFGVETEGRAGVDWCCWGGGYWGW